MILIDATGVLSSFGSPPTGIPRVEKFLVTAALADPDRAVKVVRYDRRRNAFRELRASERQHIISDPDLDDLQSGKAGLTTTIRRVFRFIRNNSAIGRDADRYFGDLAAGNNRRRGFAYAAMKYLFRAYRLYHTALREPSSLWAAEHMRIIDPGTGTVLLSNQIVLASFLAKALQATNRTAFICHDVIPIIRSDLVVDAAHARRFAKNIALILQSHATVICTSETSAAMFTGTMTSARAGAARIYRFPMPSILYEKAARTGRLSRISAPEPFILYPSTIEARKNHLLLAQVWQQAIDEGVALPKLVCVGKWGWGIDGLIEYLGKHPALSSRIEFIGPISDGALIDYYRSALFGVAPSRLEGWGYCASEGLDFGIPVIISTDRALRESTGGLMPAIDADDRAGWYAEIRRMTEDGAYRAALCQRIASTHRPTAAATSWTSIKAALHDRVADAAAKPER